MQAGHSSRPEAPRDIQAICPYHHLLLWLSLTTKEQADSHLFSLNSVAVTKAEWSRKLKYLVKAAGLDPKLYSGHSLRIGGLSALKESGLSNSEV
ncbi:hypothetical protein SARC_01326 [Sphaeroforma arctica JP610]|uniref:Tyr recombinase domain-containing protein n=1 Tax=Sphaeroforma arctica JP610 TaxID=667725 RepID=A0A0L0GE70_9EUKA|nr:hypothetical protein SARC_01326 [Sphaeroforma arctica JP610]KNC86553.1 hypothetical protein SARC_01326 [Sphaeroforma arctica JP610]|eukprot:XP_014160455.1 hypothetical protein SARC_01326 [Sphaeroforma arctica JP610]